MKIVKLVVALLFGLMFINAGLNKFFNYMPVPEMTQAQMDIFGAFMKITWLMPLIAVIEIIGGILVIPAKTRALGAIIILPVMTGILLHHAIMEPSGLVIAVVLAVINVWMIIDNRKKYEAMIS